MIEQLSKDIIEALREGNKPKLDALRYLKAMLIENKTAKAPKPELDVVVSHVKKLKDAISLYPEGNDQRDKLQAEIGYLESYLPKQLTEQEVLSMIDEIKRSMEAPSFNNIMKELSPKIKGRFDGKRASELVRGI